MTIVLRPHRDELSHCFWFFSEATNGLFCVAPSGKVLALLSIQDFFEEKKYNKPNIILKINDVNNLAKAKKLGADEVISPVSLATTQILKSITKTSE